MYFNKAVILGHVIYWQTSEFRPSYEEMMYSNGTPLAKTKPAKVTHDNLMMRFIVIPYAAGDKVLSLVSIMIKLD